MTSQAPALTKDDLEALRRYAAGADLADIAKTLGVKRDVLGLRMARLCNLNRNRARELTRDLPPMRRPAGRRTDPDPVEHDRIDRVFAKAFVEKSPQLGFLVDAARALSAACDRELVPGCPMEAQIRDVDLAIAALDGTTVRAEIIETEPPPTQPAAKLDPEFRGPDPWKDPRKAATAAPAPEPLERWSAWRCPTCRHLGQPDNHPDTCADQLQPVSLLVVPRQAAPCPS